MRFERRAQLLTLLAHGLFTQGLAGQSAASNSERVVIHNHPWLLVGELQLPASDGPSPAVLLLNQAAGDRTAYRDMAARLASKGIASLRLDLRGHGESTNAGRFIPGRLQRDPLIWDAESDVLAAHRYLQAHETIDPARIGMVGASYSGEEMAEAGRQAGYAAAYVLLSPGSLSDTSIAAMAPSGVPWLFVAAADDPFLREVTASVRRHAGSSAEFLVVPGTSHAADMLVEHDQLAESLVTWIAGHLR